VRAEGSGAAATSMRGADMGAAAGEIARAGAAERCDAVVLETALIDGTEAGARDAEGAESMEGREEDDGETELGALALGPGAAFDGLAPLGGRDGAPGTGRADP
jgi:hypothetical protein